jgi:hypothetical protein
METNQRVENIGKRRFDKLKLICLNICLIVLRVFTDLIYLLIFVIVTEVLSTFWLVKLTQIIIKNCINFSLFNLVNTLFSLRYLRC